jgi:hypothetical protein
MRSLLGILSIFLFSSCSSYQEFEYITQEFEIPFKIFRSDFTQTWQSTIQILQKYDLAVQNKESGTIKTRWIDNTLQTNFEDSFGGDNLIKGAKFKLVVNVIKGFRASREVTKVSIFKRQMLEKDFLQGWKVQRSDGVLEQTLLYRIERVILIDNKLRELEAKKNRKIEESF